MANEMLTVTLQLDAVPGGIPPKLHLKKDTSGVAVNLLVLKSDEFEGTKGVRCVIRGTRADGEELFFTAFSGVSDSKVYVTLYSTSVKKMAGAVGSYSCMLTILDTKDNVTRDTYQSYNFLTVLAFTVIVYDTAGRDG
jgi:hypothetical protein